MKILVLSPVHPFPPTDGNRLRIASLIEQAARRHEVALLAFLGHGQTVGDTTRLDSMGVQAKFVPHTQAALADRVRHRLQRSLQGIPYRAEAAMVEALRASLTDTSYDIVQVEHLYMAQYGMLVPHPRLLLDLHNVEPYRALPDAPRRIDPLGVAQADRERFQGALPRSYKGLLTVSSEEAAMIGQAAPGVSAWVVPNGVDLDRYPLTPDSDAQPHTLVFTGQMDYQPNDDAMSFLYYDILPQVRALGESPDVRIVGKHPSEQVRSFADDVPPHVFQVTGEVEDVRPEMARATVFIVPLRMGAGTKLKVIEAMALGKAIVTTSIGCEGLDIEHGREALIADDAQSFAEHIVELLRDPALRQKLGAAARATIEAKYTWGRVGDALEQAYQALSRA